MKRTTRAKIAECYTLAFQLRTALGGLQDMVAEDIQDGDLTHLDEKETGKKLWVMRNTASQLFYDIQDMGDKLKV